MWQQVYDPLNNQALSALVAAVPILVFLLGLTVLKMKGLHAALVSLASAVALAVLVFGMPFASSLSAIGYGFLSGMWPIGWIVLMAVWLYRITVRAGNFEVIRGSVSAISADQRIQVLLSAVCPPGRDALLSQPHDFTVENIGFGNINERNRLGSQVYTDQQGVVV